MQRCEARCVKLVVCVSSVGIAAYFFCTCVLLGGMVMPTVLIGVISLAFDKATEEMKLRQVEKMTTDLIMEQSRTWASQDLTDEQVESLRAVFDALNVDGTGGLSREEILPLMSRVCGHYFNHPLSKEKLFDMYEIIDRNKDDDISFPEVSHEQSIIIHSVVC